MKAMLRQSVSLPAPLARRVKVLAKTKKTSASRVITELIETGLNAQEQERQRFFALADQLVHSTKADERRRLKEELARLTFGG
jgi:metal-responsive CopG/Arc/MetJ family transcriptional regulator